MKMNNFRRCTTVLCLILISTLIKEIKTLNWFEAQEQCRDRGGLTIEKNKSTELYWTGRYRRITPWIKIKGCYNDSFLPTVTTKANLSMTRKSVGICQEMCQRENTTVFAVKAENCICIKDVKTMFLLMTVNPGNCDFECLRGADNIYKYECGGTSSYNVFEVESTTENLNQREKCLSLQCSSGDTKFIPEVCSKNLNKFCQTQASGNAGKWAKVMKECKTAANPSYLFGDVDLHNASLTCEKINTTGSFVLGWIGVARQAYNNKDIGYEFGEDDKLLIIKCESCNRTNCIYGSCYKEITSSIFCTRVIKTTVQTDSSSSLIDTTPMTIKTSPPRQTTISRYITRYTTEQETSVIETVSANGTAQKKGADDGNSITIFLPIIAVGVLLIIAAILTFYLRKKKLGQKKGTEKTPTDLPSVKTVCEEKRESSSSPYFVLEKTSKEISNRGPLITESPYNDTEEGEYDHLRDTRSRKDKQEEDTYQHASAGISNDVSDYDTMANSSVIKMTEEEGTYDHPHTSVNKMSEEDGTYDHAHPVTYTNRNTDYGYNMPSHGSCNDNPYDIAESK